MLGLHDILAIFVIFVRDREVSRSSLQSRARMRLVVWQCFGTASFNLALLVDLPSRA